jgi:site-specific DNA-methyltransferase (adenine-specific)
MKLDAVVGNPPYQVNVGEKKDNYGIPIYNHFINISKALKPMYISMISPSRWFTGGRGLEEFRKSMLKDNRICYIKDFIDAKDIFPTADISGGINYFLWDRNYSGLCDFHSIVNAQETNLLRKLDEYEIFTRQNAALTLISQIKKQKEPSLSPQISPQTPFGFVTTYRGRDRREDEDVALYTSGGITYVKRNEVKKNKNWIDLYKVIFSKATCEHAGTPDRNGKYRVFSTMKILKPNEICTQSYLVGGVFKNVDEATNYIKYLKTKFVRGLILPTLTSQDLSADKFMFVPLQDFSKPWTDEELYKKYKLTDDEIQFIESMIKPMD